MHMINFTRLPLFSACSVEKLREPGDKAVLRALLAAFERPPLLTAGGVGDDVYSVGFDGARYWVGGRAIDTTLTFTRSRMLPRQEEHILFSPSHSPSPSPSPPLEEEQLPISVGDVIGCCLDLERGVASFLKNGVLVEGHIEFHHCCKNITPALSFSAGIR